MIGKLKNLFDSDFSRNVLTLATGTTIAQAIPIAISPILTRIYTPEEFGVFALFLSFTAILTSIVNGKYEMAIMLPKSDTESLIVVKLSLYISTFISTVCFLILFFTKGKIALALNEPKIENWLLLIPLSIFIAGFYNALNFYNTRNNRYLEVSKSQVSKSMGLSLGQIGLGVLKLSHGGLIVGKLIADLFGNLVLFRILKSKTNIITQITFQECKLLAKRYRKFPFFSLPSVLLNSITLNSTNFFITSLFSAQTLGFYSLSNKILGLPSVVIGRSIGQVYYQEACRIRSLGKSILPIFTSTLLKLSLISAPIFAILYFIIVPVFIFVFGEEWSIAGNMAQIILPLIAFRFISSTLSSTLVIVERQELSFFINVILLSTTLLVFYIASIQQYKILRTLELFTYALSFCYVLFCVFYYFLAKKTVNEVAN